MNAYGILRIAIAIIIFDNCRHANGQDIDKMVSGNAASIDQIQTLHVSIKQKSLSNGLASEIEAEYWKKDDKVVVIEKTSADRMTYVIQEKDRMEVVTVMDQSIQTQDMASIIRGNRNRRSIETDAWELFLFKLPVGIYRQKPYARYSLQDAVNKSSPVKVSKVDGNYLLKLDLEGGLRKYEVITDPSKNWLAVDAKHLVYKEPANERPMFRIHTIVNEFTEPVPGILIPKHVITTIDYEGSRVNILDTEFTAIEVNNSDFMFPKLPAIKYGTKVIDEVAGLVYAVDEKGKRIGDSQQLLDPHSPATSSPPNLLPLTNDAKFQIGATVLILGLAIIVVILLVKKKRNLGGKVT